MTIFENTDNLTAIEILSKHGFNTSTSELPFCLDNGIEFHIGYKENIAGIAAMITDESNYLIDKAGIKEMIQSAKIKGTDKVQLFTNYGLELRHDESAKSIGLDKIIKVIKPF